MGFPKRKIVEKIRKDYPVGCEENTVVGTIALHRGRTIGESVFDPVFVIAAILEWAGIAKNGRGELILTEEHNDL